MAESTVNSKVVRNSDRNRYEIFYGEDLAGFADYSERGDETVFTHTEIDKAFGGKGLGSTLAAAAVREAIGRDRVIRPVCSFIKSYLDQHPEHDAHVVGKGVERA